MKKILFFEQHKIIQLFGMTKLEEESFKVLLPPNIEAPLELLKNDIPDVLITDF